MAVNPWYATSLFLAPFVNKAFSAMPYRCVVCHQEIENRPQVVYSCGHINLAVASFGKEAFASATNSQNAASMEIDGESEVLEITVSGDWAFMLGHLTVKVKVEGSLKWFEQAILSQSLQRGMATGFYFGTQIYWSRNDIISFNVKFDLSW